MRIGPLALPALTALSLFACTTPRPLLLGDDAADARAAIAAAWRDHVEGARRKDLDAVMAMYDENVVYVVDGTAPVIGFGDLRAMEQRGLNTGDVESAQHESEALKVDGDLAYELGVVAGRVAPTGKPAQHVVFHFVAMWRWRASHGWKLAHLVGQVEAAAAASADPPRRL